MQTLPRQDEHRPRLYLGKDEVECGITAAMTRGGPAVRTREMGKYFQAVQYMYPVDADDVAYSKNGTCGWY